MIKIMVLSLATLLVSGCAYGVSAHRCTTGDIDADRACQQREREAARDAEREQIERERWERAVGRRRAPNPAPRVDLAQN